MIKVLLFTCLAGLVAAQYGRGGSGYGPDGVRNRYFILGHGRGPISTTLGSGIYGTSLGSSSHSGYRAPARSSGHGSSGYGHESSGGYGSSGLSGGHGGSSLGGHHSLSYAPSAPAYAPAPQSYAPAPRAYAPAPRAYAPAPQSYAPAPQSYAPAPQSYAPAHQSYAPAPQSYAPAISSYSAPSSGYSAPSRNYGDHDDLAKPTPYDFGYDVHNEHGDQQSRQETGDGHGNVKGSYGYRDSYGIFRHVDYVADHAGFRATVRTNEPGTDNQDPADVKMQVEHGHGY